MAKTASKGHRDGPNEHVPTEHIFAEGMSWETQRVAQLESSRKLAWRIAIGAAVLVALLVIAIVLMLPLRRTIPYLVKVDTSSGNLEVLHTFDNLTIGKGALTDKHWAARYVQAREQYNWFLVSGDVDFVSRLTAEPILKDYLGIFDGPKSLDKLLGQGSERIVKVLSVAPMVTNPSLMVVRFERTTRSKGQVLEQPTVYVATLAFRYLPKTLGAESELIANPHGYQVTAYRVDVEQLRMPVEASPGDDQRSAGAGAAQR